MNLLHMKYAVEISKTGSISKASENLYVAQPNLSRSLKELEAELGIEIFDRTSKGMKLTPKGEILIHYAKNVLQQVEDMSKIKNDGKKAKQIFSISVPRASYIADAFAKFTNCLSEDSADIYYMETNPRRIIHNIVDAGYKLGILRYAIKFEKFYTELLEERGLSSKNLAEFKYQVIMSRNHPLAGKKNLKQSDLHDYIEITHGDPYVPSLPKELLLKEEDKVTSARRIFLFERGGQFDVLMENTNTFMWVSPLPKKLLKRYNLVQKTCTDNTRIYKDVIIFRKDYILSELDMKFIEELRDSKEKCF